MIFLNEGVLFFYTQAIEITEFLVKCASPHHFLMAETFIYINPAQPTHLARPSSSRSRVESLGASRADLNQIHSCKHKHVEPKNASFILQMTLFLFKNVAMFRLIQFPELLHVAVGRRASPCVVREALPEPVDLSDLFSSGGKFDT